MAGRMRGDGDRKYSGDRGAGDGQPESFTDTVSERSAPSMANEPVVGDPQPIETVVLAPESDELRAPRNGFDELRRELAPCGCRPAAPPRQSRRAVRNDQSARQQAQTQAQASGRKERCSDRDGDGSREDRDERRPDASEVEILERVDVSDEPRQQVSTPLALELCRRERLDPVIDVAANAGQEPKGQVVRAEAFEVARYRPGDA